jgi:tetratricopeptide (TPR) repeat protein
MSIDSTLPRRMTMAKDAGSNQKFVLVYLPWLIAAAALGVFLITINPWVNFVSLFTVTRVSGLAWQPSLSNPVYWLATLPFKWLPIKMIPLALNCFAAVCGALTLALLARSVALLPHDRTEEQRIRERSPFSLLTISLAWIPPVFAAIICGLQLSFWENATVASGEMLDLLLFAYIVRCILEFRISEAPSWLYRAAFVYGIALTDNWAMVPFFPAFLAVLIWIMGVTFFDLQFLVRFSLAGLAGLSLYLLLPIAGSFSSAVHVPFWQGLRYNLSLQHNLLFQVVFNKWIVFKGDRPLWVLALPSLVPLLALGIRWPAYFGDPSKLGVSLATSVFHFLHALMLVVCTWVAFDPQFSPRNYNPALLPGNILLLPFYYLGALCAGYFVGYFLLVFGAKPLGRPRTISPLMNYVNPVVVGIVLLIALVTPAGLIWRNFAQIRLTNGANYERFAAQMQEGLPKKHPVVMSDDPRRLYLLQLHMARSEPRNECVFLDTASLYYPDYQRFLKKVFPTRWQSSPTKNRIARYEDRDLIRLAYNLGESNSLCYLHPSFGYYFEMFYSEPHGLVEQMTRYQNTDNLFPPPISKELVEENQKFWERIRPTTLLPLIKAVTTEQSSGKSAGFASLESKLRLPKQINPNATSLADCYSRSLTAWGVRLQKLNLLEPAAAQFERALELKPDNIVARVNGECNRKLQAGEKTSVELSSYIIDLFGKFKNWDQIMNVNGPFDEPTFCYEQGQVMVHGGNYRQATQEFQRAVELAPDSIPPRLQLAESYLSLGDPGQALKLIQDIRANPEFSKPNNSTNETILNIMEANAWFAQNDETNANAAIGEILSKHPNDEDILGVCAQIYIRNGRLTNALELIDKQLAIRPDNQPALMAKGITCLQISNYVGAVQSLSKLISLETTNFSGTHYSALYTRSQAFLEAGRLESAQKDLEILERAFPTEFRVYYGLGEIAYRKGDTNAAIRCYQLCLNNAPSNLSTNSTEAQTIHGRLKELRRTLR